MIKCHCSEILNILLWNSQFDPFLTELLSHPITFLTFSEFLTKFWVSEMQFMRFLTLWKWTPYLWMMEPNGSMYRQKRMGPKTEPWETPYETVIVSLRVRNFSQPVKCGLLQFKVQESPIYVCSLFVRRSRSTVSALRSRSTRMYLLLPQIYSDISQNFQKGGFCTLFGTEARSKSFKYTVRANEIY